MPAILGSLKPSVTAPIMDLVEAAGIDVSPWSVKKGGIPVRNPRANPNYCYEWAFGGGAEPTALCVWFRHLEEDGGLVFYEANIREHARKLGRLVSDRFAPKEVRHRSRDQERRALKFDSLVQRAFRTASPVRLVLLVGEPKKNEELGLEAARVDFRQLDPEPWYVHAYDDDGNYRIVRSIPMDMPRALPASPAPPRFVDQFSVPEPPERRATSGTAFARDAEVRRAVLDRAEGKCEHCGEPGFEMSGDVVYLETHHVVPLSEGGLDAIWNVVAICPNDHRYAHHALKREEMRNRLITLLVQRYPEAKKAFAKIELPGSEALV